MSLLNRFSLLILFLVPVIAFSQSLPHTEVRAVWLTTANGLDWPRSNDVKEQQESLARIVRELKAAHFNTIFFQVRARADAYYRSRFEPWAENLTGTSGKDPGWDPLAFLLQEAHNVGIEVHAWFNVFKLRNANGTNGLPAGIQKNWIVTYAGEKWLDPGLPEVRAYLLDVVLDLAQHYDIDGINFDYMRYPGENFADQSTYRRYGGGEELTSWRRGNIDRFVTAVYDQITALKPTLKVGSSPLGNVNGGGETDPRVVFGQDATRWMLRGKQDYLSPQIYWNIGASEGDPDFALLTETWRTIAGVRHLYTGIAAYKPDVAAELPTEIDTARSLGAEGQAFFRYEFIKDTQRFAGRYSTLAEIPSMPWKSTLRPTPPRHPAVTETEPMTFFVEWLPPQKIENGDSARWYALFRSSSYEQAERNEGTLVSITPSTCSTDTVSQPTHISYYYTITALDRINNESAPSEIASITAHGALAMRNQLASFNSLASLPSTADGGVPPLIAYRLAERVPVTLELYRKTGDNQELVKVLVNRLQERGLYVVGLRGIPLDNGEYEVRLNAGDTSLAQPITLAH